MSELKPCPFCGGYGKISVRNAMHRKFRAEYKKYVKQYSAQVICNKCHARGKPIRFFSEKWGDFVNVPYLEQKKDIEPWLMKAEQYWNGRAADDD